MTSLIIAETFPVKIYSLIIELSLFRKIEVKWLSVLLITMPKSFSPSRFRRLPGLVNSSVISII
jgi:hypothetical protein